MDPDGDHNTLTLMINRSLIRLKVVQLVYAYYQNEGKTTEVALKELDFSLQKTYDLYLSLLSLLVSLRRLAQHKTDVRSAAITLSAQSNDKIFAENQFLLQLEDNAQLALWLSKQKTTWEIEDKFVKRLYDTITRDDCFLTYVDKGDRSYEADREVIRRLYKTHIVANEEFAPILEEQSLYWNDDKDIIDSFVMKTIKRFVPETGAEQELLPAYSADEDKSFAPRLFTAAIERADELRDRMRHNTRNWDFERMALMDIIIIQIAAAEALTFPSIPLNVTFSEFLNIAKFYSTPRSTGYVNGMLDTIIKQYKEEGVILK